MGLTIHYQFRSPAGHVEDARRLVGQLRQRAMDLPFKYVGDLLDLSGDACDYEQRDRDDPHRWLLIQANQPIQRDHFMYHVPPKHLIAFSTSPGEGSEPANFGLCLYPRTVDGHPNHGVKRVRTGLASGWSWHSFCKTQYASNPTTGDIENFLRCHLSVIRLLDESESLGILHEVSDEGGYYEGRDVKALVEEVGRWNEMIAGFVGEMKDLLGGKDVESEITKFPNYEHLEAEGRTGEAGERKDDE